MSQHHVDKTYGLIGYPLMHSFSKDYFNQKFESEGISAEYVNFEIDDVNKLTEIISETPNLCGLNVTLPYKQQVIPFLDSLDEGANEIGAVNVIRFVRNGGEGLSLRGYNTDASAFQKSIEPLLTPARSRALVLGTGGASKAIAYALRQLGVEVQFVSRRKTASTLTYEELTKAMMHSHKIVVNTTPLGMYPHVDECPDIPYRFITSEHLCYDLIYNPDETKFMRQCRQHGATVKNGLEMLLLQAFQSYEIWNMK